MALSPVYSRIKTATFQGGSDDYLEVNHRSGLKLAKGTISLGFTTESTRGTYAIISKDARHNNEGEFTVWVRDGELRVTFEQDGKSETVRAEEILIEPDETYHIAVTFGDNGLTLWVNGDLAATETDYTDGIDGNSANLVIGGTRAWTEADKEPHSLFRGEISHVQVFDRQLNEGQIMGLATDVSPVIDDAARMADMMDKLMPTFAQAHHASLTFKAILADYGVSSHGHMMSMPAMQMGTSGNDDVDGTENADAINGMMGDDLIDGLGGNDVLQGYYGNDTLNGDAGNDILDGGHGEDVLNGGAGDDLLISTSDAREPEIAYVPGRDEGDPDNELTNGKLYPDQPIPANDVLIGGEGADIFYFQTQINAKKRFVQEHTRDDGTINWHGVAGENDDLHNHWVDALGCEYIMDFSREEGDRIVIEGHTTEIQSIEYGDEDGDGVVDHTIITLYSDQGNNGGAHQYDQLGKITVYGDLVTEADIEHTAAPAYGIITSIEDLKEAITPKTNGTSAGPIAPPDDLGSGQRFVTAQSDSPVFVVGGVFDFQPQHRAPLVFDHDKDMETSQGTIAMTISVTNLSGQSVLFSKDAKDRGEGGHITAYVKDNGDLVVRLQSEDDDEYLVAQGAIAEDTQYDIVITFGNGGAHLYVDGVRLSSILESTYSMADNSEHLIVGAGGWSNTPGETDRIGHYFDGTITNFVMYDTQLDAVDVPTTADAPPEDTRIYDFTLASATLTRNADGDLVISHGNNTYVVPPEVDTLIFSDIRLVVNGVTVGGDEADNIKGSDQEDYLSGKAGADLLDGGEKDDLLEGGSGADTLKGGADDDTLLGNSSADMLYGDSGTDNLAGGSGSDSLHGGKGDDVINGDKGSDGLFGDSGDDLLNGGKGADMLNGGAHDDTLLGGSGGDTLKGGSGNDKQSGNKGNDVLSGNNGADKLSGNAGKDDLSGGNGSDSLNGGSGNDDLSGGKGSDDLRGSSGNDLLVGGKGDDSLWGGNGKDTLDGGAGDDMLYGGSQADTFIYNSGKDVIADFDARDDSIELSSDLFSGNLSARQVVNRYGSEKGDDFVLKFSNGDTLTFTNGVDTDDLVNALSVI